MVLAKDKVTHSIRLATLYWRCIHAPVWRYWLGACDCVAAGKEGEVAAL